MDFFNDEPTPRTSWRLVVLMGANTRTYKFALGQALLGRARTGQDLVPLSDLAADYAGALLPHLEIAPQASKTTQLGDQDFLSVARRESEASHRLGRPTEALVDAAVRTIPGMVMVKFHNLRGVGEVAHRFYELEGRGSDRVVRLTRDLISVAQSEQSDSLLTELEARWGVVESSFHAEIGRSLVQSGVTMDWDSLRLTDRHRRRSIAGVREAVIGFQHGRCLICWEPIDETTPVAIDHVYPHSLMSKMGVLGWHGPDLDSLWNLAPAHGPCNSRKSDALPTSQQQQQLARRNAAIMKSPHPLRKTLELSLRSARLSGNDTATWMRLFRTVVY